MKDVCRNLTTNKWFELTIIAVILLNSVLIGVETYTDNSTIRLVQESTARRRLPFGRRAEEMTEAGNYFIISIDDNEMQLEDVDGIQLYKRAH